MMFRSPSTRKVWIEMFECLSMHLIKCRHLPHGRCGLKSPPLLCYVRVVWSPSTRKVWIEINIMFRIYDKAAERHLPHGRCGLKYSYWIDKYNGGKGHLPHGRCGLKFLKIFCLRMVKLSPSTRKVWIEIKSPSSKCKCKHVTFHTEGVD